MAIQNLATRSSLDTHNEGVDLEGESISLELTDDEVLDVLGGKIEGGVAFWNKELGLDNVRKQNEQRWMNKNLEVGGFSKLYKFQVPYRDNRIFVSVETLATSVAAQFPEPTVIEGQDTDASRQLAQDYNVVLKSKAETLNIKGALQMVARHLLMGYRVGVIKSEWDFDAGRLVGDSYSGDVKVSFKRPHKIVFDAEADDKSDVPLIAENMRSTVEELAIKFPDKKDQIWKKAGISSTDRVKFGKKVDYWEAWFTYRDKGGNKKEGVAWRMGDDLLLDSGLNPYFNYGSNQNKSNFFDQPKKPYTIFNYLQLGKYILDDTSLTEQAGTLQDILEKRGRQIVENADRANSTTVFNSDIIDAKDAQKYVGDPTQVILVKGDVRAAFKRESPPLLPSYVMQDKFDARNEIDNIFGTHAPIRGEKTESPTLGQEVISQRSDLGRIKPLVDVIGDGAIDVYGWMSQLYKLFG